MDISFILVKVTQSCPTLCDPMWRLYSSWNTPSQNTGVGSLSHLQGISPTDGLSPGLLHCRQILYQLSHKESPRILEWVAYPFSRRSSWPRNRIGVSCIISGFFFTNWAIRKAHYLEEKTKNKDIFTKSIWEMFQGRKSWNDFERLNQLWILLF